MPFGLTIANAPATFQHLMKTVLASLVRNIARPNHNYDYLNSFTCWMILICIRVEPSVLKILSIILSRPSQNIEPLLYIIIPTPSSSIIPTYSCVAISDNNIHNTHSDLCTNTFYLDSHICS